MLKRRIECFYDVQRMKTFLPILRDILTLKENRNATENDSKTIIGDKWSLRLRSDASRGRFRESSDLNQDLWFNRNHFASLMDGKGKLWGFATHERENKVWLTFLWKAKANFPLPSSQCHWWTRKEVFASRFNFISIETIRVEPLRVQTKGKSMRWGKLDCLKFKDDTKLNRSGKNGRLQTINWAKTFNNLSSHWNNAVHISSRKRNSCSRFSASTTEKGNLCKRMCCATPN